MRATGLKGGMLTTCVRPVHQPCVGQALPSDCATLKPTNATCRPKLCSVALRGYATAVGRLRWGVKKRDCFTRVDILDLEVCNRKPLLRRYQDLQLFPSTL